MQLIKTPEDLGQIIRARRKELRWSQAQLAQQIGASRQWLIDVEKGKPRAEFGLILRLIYALGLSMHLDRGRNEVAEHGSPNRIDINRIADQTAPYASGVGGGSTTVGRALDEAALRIMRARNDTADDIRKLMREQNSASGAARQPRMQVAESDARSPARRGNTRATASRPSGKKR